MHIRYADGPGHDPPSPDAAVESLRALLGNEADTEALMEEVIATAEGLSGGAFLT